MDLTRQLGSLDSVTPVTEVQKCCKEKGVQRDRCGTSRFSGLTTSEGQTREELNPGERGRPGSCWAWSPAPASLPLLLPSAARGEEVRPFLQAQSFPLLSRPSRCLLWTDRLPNTISFSPRPFLSGQSLRQTSQHTRAPRIPLPISCFGCSYG